MEDEGTRGGALRIPRARDDDFADGVVRARRELCERLAGRPLPHLFGASVPLVEARGNVENAVGFAQVPVGIAGPLRVNGAEGSYEVVVPLATTEGAMVASYSRGMRLLAAAGGARARVVHEGLTQNPVLVYRSAADALAAAERVRGLVDELEALAAAHTRHGRLSDVRAELLGRRLVLCLTFETGDAIGINMAARAADDCSARVAEATGAVERYVHGEDVEKRANARALIGGRGRSAVCEATVPGDALRELCRVEPEALVRIHRTYCQGYAHLGTHNWLVQAANGLVALMIACGQDPAYVTESATGFLDFEVTPEGDLWACAVLPSLLVGSVGGGSGQGTAAECLELLGCRGDGRANRLAEVAAATVLAGDLSLLAAFCAHEFVAAHERLGRNRPDPAGAGGSEAP